MRITVQVLIQTGADQTLRTETLGVIERDAERAPASGLGLSVGDNHEIVRKLQAVVLREQVMQFIDRVARCARCRLPPGIKDRKTIVYRTAFGKARLDSPGSTPPAAAARCRHTAASRSARWPSSCPSGCTRSGCGCKAAMRRRCRTGWRSSFCAMPFRPDTCWRCRA